MEHSKYILKAINRFHSKYIIRENGCWEWPGNISNYLLEGTPREP